MSDTTITPEERALWASTAAARINAVTPERQCEITAQERLVKALKALEQAEDRAEELEEYTAKLVCELTDGKLSKPYDISVITDEVESIYRAYYEDEISKATAKTEADNARLRDALQTAESALSLAHHRGQYDLVDKALSKVCTALYGNKNAE